MYRLGCSGWFYPHWQGIFYPSPQSRWFGYYATKFNTVELNSPFYNFPKESTVKAWYRNAPKGFVYTLKVNKYITHMKKFKNAKTQIKKFYTVCSLLNEKLGCFLFQLPPSLHFSEAKLKEIVTQLDTEKKNVIEFRHNSWFCAETYDELKENGIMFCIVSAPRLPDTFVKTAKDIYIRFHGKLAWYAHNYGDRELREWASKIKKYKNAWIYFNNDAMAFAPKNCLRLKEILKA